MQTFDVVAADLLLPDRLGKDSMLFACDDDFRIAYISETVEPLLGYTPEEIVGRTCEDFVDQEHPIAVAVTQRKQTGEPMDVYEQVLLHEDGSRRFVEVRAVGEVKIDGKSRSVRLARDITDTIDLEERVDALLRNFGEVCENRDQRLRVLERAADMALISSAVSHEVKQLMFVVQNYAYAMNAELQRGAPDFTLVAELARNVQANSERANQVLVRMRQLGAGVNPVTQPTCAVQLVTDALGRLDSRIQGSEICIEQVIPSHPQEDFFVNVDSVQIEQVLINLLENGIDSLQAIDDQRRLITLEISSDQEWVGIAVRDNGAGFPVEPTDFQRVESPKLNGMGIGLAISSRIVTAHGGTMEASNCQPSGAKVTIRLPRHFA